MYPMPCSRRYANSAVGDVFAEQLYRTGCDVSGSDDRVDQFGLAVAFDTGNPDDLTAMHGDAEVIDDRPVELGDHDVFDLHHDDIGDSRFAWLPASEARSRPSARRARERSTSAGFTVATVRPCADDGDVVGDRQHLVELVGDEDDGGAVGFELAEVAEQFVDLLRHQHGRRLVEDQDLGAAVQHLEDLDPLALADAEVLDQGVGVDVEPVRLADLGERARLASSKLSTPPSSGLVRRG